MKKQISIIVAAFLILNALSLAVFATDAPPSIDLGGLLDEEPAPNNTSPNNTTNNDTPPTLNLGGTSDNTNTNTSTTTIKITNDSASPKAFNALTGKTKISYTISADAIINVSILNSNNQTVLTLVNNQTVKAGEYYTQWNGTSDNRSTGTAVSAGKYKYRVTAKNPTTGRIDDTQESEIIVMGVSLASNTSGTSSNTSQLESANSGSGSQNTRTTTSSTGSNSTYTSSQRNATVTLQNTRTGTTAQTGPGVLIYAFAPLVGYFISRKRS